MTRELQDLEKQMRSRAGCANRFEWLLVVAIGITSFLIEVLFEIYF